MTYQFDDVRFATQIGEGDLNSGEIVTDLLDVFSFGSNQLTVESSFNNQILFAFILHFGNKGFKFLKILKIH